MWLPEPIYEVMPYLYLVIGALFLGGAIYIGAGSHSVPYYIALGILSIIGGVVIHMKRMAARQQRADSNLSQSH